MFDGMIKGNSVMFVVKIMLNCINDVIKNF